ncbi:MAG: type II secretion system protein, partial [Acidisphaera sp.]|nr:type II secretion system protein [Acidisphaera sp.]MBV9812699.1 type II secretion system protein [Acetobacteraceae bacterium]
MRRRRDRDGEAGFTLLEILVALVVFGFLMAGLSQGVRFGLTAWQSQTRTIERTGDLDTVERVLRQLVERLAPGRLIDPPNIEGTASTLGFTSDLPTAAAALTLRHADMVLAVDPAHRLVLRWTPHLHAVRSTPPVPQSIELLAGVDHVALSYWPRDGEGWRDTWKGRTPPALIRIRIVFP